ncbi:MAG: manganese efflux pump [Clostridiales bacterium]|nr:manganese efflux pump [Clostridiales bacterium]
MGIVELLFLAIGLSMDAFAVSIANGLSKKNINAMWTIGIGACFGLFQGVMPVIGYALGSSFAKYITSVDHIIAIVLLGYIGGKMIYDGIKFDEDDINQDSNKLSFGQLMVQGVATSIDALAVGISLAALKVDIVASASFICIVTFIFSVFGVLIGKRFGSKLSNKAQILGGLILVGIGLKIFIEHAFLGG